jgi:hypothetical protein
MDENLRSELAKYVIESERAIKFAADKEKKLKEEVTACKCKIRNLEDTIFRQQAMLIPLQRKDKVEIRKKKRNDTYTKKALGTAFGKNDCCDDSPLFQAALGFMKGSQVQKQRTERRQDEDEIDLDCTVAERRCGKEMRKKLLADMITYMYDGEIMRDITSAILKKKRFCTVTLARVSDLNSTFTASAVGCIAKCEGGKEVGEMGLLCGESTLRRTMDLVHDQAVQLGFSCMPEKDLGKVWCWGEGDEALLTKAVNMYVKAIYCDASCESVTKDNPWLVPLSGDAVRTSTRGKVVTVMGPKQSDLRLTSQERTGKSMCQSSGLYTPAVAGFGSEEDLMGYFHSMVQEFLKIEEQGFCTVNGNKWDVHIKVVVVADLSFLQKYVKRGGSSHHATCFCMLCSAFRDFRHQGYPGGCRKCRRAGTVYGKDGIQQCPHHEACTVEFLKWQRERYSELCALVPNIPLTKLPAWTTVDELRHECMERCVGERAWELPVISRRTGKGAYTAEKLTNWIMQYCRGGCTLSNDKDTGVIFCDLGIVRKCLLERGIHIAYGVTDASLRLQMQEILQLEDEYARMTLAIRDSRFDPGHPSAQAVPVERLIVCMLHCPMRTHEKVLTMLMQSACQHRTLQKSKPILDSIAAIIRQIGNLPDTWTYKMDDGNKGTVAKVKMHFDQSKHIFAKANMGELKKIIRLAIPFHNRKNWMLFLKAYIKLIELLTTSRDYTEADLLQLEGSCDETYRLLIAHCGGKAAVTNYFHYIGSGHIVWMCRRFGNIWRYRGEGVEAFNKTLSKRCNMFNSAGNKGNLQSSGKVKPFEVLGKWLGRYVMWQLEFANNVFIGQGAKLGPTEICWDSSEGKFVLDEDKCLNDADEADYDYEIGDETSDSDCELDAFTAEDLSLCGPVHDDNRYTFRKRARNS